MKEAKSLLDIQYNETINVLTILFTKYFNQKYKQTTISDTYDRPKRLRPPTTNSIKKLARKIAKLMTYCPPKFIKLNNSQKYDGIQIYKTELENLNNSELLKDYNLSSTDFFTKSPSSTYHSNNAKVGYNGYTHWYRVNYDSILRDFNTEKLMINHILKKEKAVKYNKTEHINILKSINKEVKGSKEALKSLELLSNKDFQLNPKFFILEKSKFLELQSIYEKTLESEIFVPDIIHFRTLVKNVVYWNEKYVFINNMTKNSKESLSEVDWGSMGEDLSMNNRGRQFTVFGFLPKTLRNLMYPKLDEIDLNVALPTVFMNLYLYDTGKDTPITKAKITKFQKDFPLVSSLINNKLNARRKISDLFYVDTKTAKTMITHLFNNPSVSLLTTYQSESSKEYTPKIKKEINSYIIPLQKEVQEIMETVTKKYITDSDNINPNLKIGTLRLRDIAHLVQNDIKTPTGKGHSLASRIHYRIYILIEKQIRDTIIFYECKIQRNNDQIHQVHDSIVSPLLRSTVGDLEDYIEYKLGLNIGLTKSTIQ